MDDYFNKFTTPKYREQSSLKRSLIKKFLSNIQQKFTQCQPKQVLDLGCGEGFNIGYLLQKNPNIKFTGVDQNKEQLDQLKNLFPEIETYQADIANLNSLPKKFDLVMALEVLEHLEDPDQALLLMKRLTNHFVLISVPWEPSFRLSNFFRGKNVTKLGDDPEHINHWTKNQITKLVKKHFTIIETSISFPWTIILAKTK